MEKKMTNLLYRIYLGDFKIIYGRKDYGFFPEKILNDRGVSRTGGSRPGLGPWTLESQQRLQSIRQQCKAL